MTLFLYPGFHKTGTTLMQTRILPELGLNYLGRYYGADHDFQVEFSDAIKKHLSDLAMGETRVSELGHLLSELIRDDTVHVLATENLLRPASTDRFLEAVRSAASAAPAGKLAVFLSIRRQMELMVSRYLHDLNTKFPTIKGRTMVNPS